MSERFYITAPPTDGHATLDGPEAHHLLHVMRAQPGDSITLFDGQGSEYPATIEKCSRSEVLVAVGERAEVDRELPVRITVGVALPKGDRQKWLVEKLTEMGASRVVPLSTQRSVADLKGKSLEKLRRSVIEASKQCGRNTLMQIDDPQPLAEFIAAATGTRLIAHPTGQSFSSVNLTDEVSLLIGPEGGFTDDEVAEALAQGWQSIGLGASILRIETAAVALVAVVAAKF